MSLTANGDDDGGGDGVHVVVVRWKRQSLAGGPYLESRMLMRLKTLKMVRLTYYEGRRQVECLVNKQTSACHKSQGKESSIPRSCSSSAGALSSLFEACG